MWKCWARRYRGGKFRLLRCAVGNGEDRRNFRAGMMLAGAGGPVALQTFPDGRGGTVAKNSDFCGARSGMGRIDGTSARE